MWKKKKGEPRQAVMMLLSVLQQAFGRILSYYRTSYRTGHYVVQEFLYIWPVLTNQAGYKGGKKAGVNGNQTQVTGLSHQYSNHWATTAQPTTILPYLYCTGSTAMHAAVSYQADHRRMCCQNPVRSLPKLLPFFSSLPSDFCLFFLPYIQPGIAY